MRTAKRPEIRPVALVAVLLAAIGLLGASAPMASAHARRAAQPIAIVAAENQYGNVARQVGGAAVRVTSIEDNPNTDPHTFEVSARVAQQIAGARLVIENGLGYDSFVSKIEQAAPSRARKTIVVQRLLHLAPSTPNPHLWYRPDAMPALAKALAGALAGIEPAKAATFQRRAARFIASLGPWKAALAAIKRRFGGSGVAVTEPVGNYLLRAAGLKVKTPFSLQTAVMNGLDPSPQDVAIEEALFSRHEVKVFVYNVQVTDSLTAQFLADAAHAHIPVVGVYETMPIPGFTYQSWMLAETRALERALADHRSTSSL
ncbi:MAG: zinc ABC transporter substrate-binding protein [Actinomycetota bacterium]|nr:zinc ABC transporter substrate-binding protein [Actinomycetota bacterium]